MGAFLGFLWCLKRVFVKTGSGRRRFNVLGALCATTHKLVTVCNDSYINSDCVCELLLKIKAASGDIPVSCVLDNAAYQRCKKVILQAADLGIELLFLPPYSPNLNLIERLWKFVKKALYNQHHETFTAFTAAITRVLFQPTKQETADLKRLLSLKFQSFVGISL